MRKLLLGTSAMVAATLGLANVASAQVAGPPNVMTMAGEQAMPSVKPGQMVVRLNGVVAWYAGIDGETQTGPATASGTTKISSYGFFGYIRLFPGFDAELANGVKYGVAAELRDGTGGSGNAATGAYWYRAGAYLGTDQVGTVWFGQTDGPAARFMVGTGENWDTGGWDGDAPGIVSGYGNPYAIDWVPPENGPEVTPNKIIYLSPSFGGFDFGLSFAPSGVGNATFAGAVPTSTRFSSVPGGSAQTRNLYELMARYKGTFGGVGLTVEGGYIGAGVVNNNTGPTGYHSISQGDAGVQATFAGVTLGGHVDFGAFNYQLQPAPKGSKSAVAYELGASYQMGPVVVGAQYTHDSLPGNYNGTTITKNLVETGFALGGTYTLTSGVAMYATYLYGEKKQAGFDWATVGGTSVGSDKVHINAFVVGTDIHW